MFRRRPFVAGGREEFAVGSNGGNNALVRSYRTGLTRLAWARSLGFIGITATTALGQSGPASSSLPTTTPRVTVDRAQGAITLELDPISLAASTSVGNEDDHSAMAEATPAVAALPVDGWLEGYSVDLLDGSGRLLPHSLIHHVNLIVPQKRELFSPIMLRIGALGSETPAVSLPAVLGYRVHPGDTLLITAMLHNPTPRPQNGVRVRVHLSYRPADSWFHPVSIYPMYLDVMPPAGQKAYDLPAGHSEKSWEARPAVAGRILAVGGHLHRYATALRLDDVTEGRRIWATAPVTDSTGTPVDMPVKKFWWQLGLPIHPDHTYRLTAVYDNPTGHMIADGAMGALGGVILPDDKTQWPAVNRSDPTYQLDKRITYETTMPGMPGMPGMSGMPAADTSAAEASAARTAPRRQAMLQDARRNGMLTTTVSARRQSQTP